MKNRAGKIQRGSARPPVRRGAPAPTELALMARVAESCGPLLARVCGASSLPVEFLAALVANESGGDPRALRFEPAVFRHLEAVAAGFTPVYAGMNTLDLAKEVAEVFYPKADSYHLRALPAVEGAGAAALFQGLGEEALRELATSWGYTQIMGYHMVGRRGTPRDLLEPERHFQVALDLLAEFAEQYQLDPRGEFEELFRCWNTGRPYGRTTDPNYVSNGLRRMEVYRALAQEKVAASAAAAC
jgi:hypothetical protein